jgi:hypothetical protein
MLSLQTSSQCNLPSQSEQVQVKKEYFLLYIYIYIYITSEKPVNDQSYGVLDRYGITILYK